MTQLIDFQKNVQESTFKKKKNQQPPEASLNPPPSLVYL